MDDWFNLLWFLIAIAVGFFLILRRRAAERRRRWKQDLCQQCGYDIRACNERCAECGAIIPENWRDPPDEHPRSGDQ